MKILELNLYKKRFDRILSGEQKEDYRPFHAGSMVTLYRDRYTHVRYKTGHSIKARTFTIALRHIERGRGNPEYGAPTYCDVYILKLGEIVPHDR